MELQYNVAEVVGEIFKTHGSQYFDIYMSLWHLLISEMTANHCLKEDRRFAFFIISDVIEFGLAGEKRVADYFSQIIPIVCDGCGKTDEPGIRQTCAFILGVAANSFPSHFAPYAVHALMSLAASVTLGEEPPDIKRGLATDNAISSIGVILEKMELVGLKLNYLQMWEQWVAYLPLHHDTVFFII